MKKRAPENRMAPAITIPETRMILLYFIIMEFRLFNNTCSFSFFERIVTENIEKEYYQTLLFNPFFVDFDLSGTGSHCFSLENLFLLQGFFAILK